MKRKAEIRRETKETKISISINLDGKGAGRISTGIGFFDHMLILFAKHGLFDVNLKAIGDKKVDSHHTVEDVGICLGEAVSKALKDKKGIRRYGFSLLPMDDALIQTAVDLSGRSYLVFKADKLKGKIGNFDAEVIEDFFRAMAVNGKMNLHINLVYGKNKHHIAEAIFKSFAKALRSAVEYDKRTTGIPSTKGKL